MPKKKNVHISALMMVKNETKRIRVSLESIKDTVDSIVIFDTGSTDDTIKIITTFCKNNKIILRLKEGEFVDFSTSRNVSLDFADSFEEIDFLLLLDTNDELRDSGQLRDFCTQQKDTVNSGFLYCQEWWSGQYDKYFNIRLVKAHKGWRYRGSVHEWMKNTGVEEGEEPPVIRVPDSTVIYQDRTQDDDKSGKRFIRDKVLLLKDHNENPTDPRTSFYLAQTCACLNQLEDAFYYYKIRAGLDGFQEEKFHSLLRCGDLSEKLLLDWHDSMTWYMKAFEHSQRVEPLLKIAEHYKYFKNWLLAFTFLNTACKLKYPNHAMLFVDKRSYDYKRWHLMGIVGFYCQQYAEGMDACDIAIKTGINKELDMKNMEHYKNHTESKGKKPNQTKKEFINEHMNTLKTENPTLSQKQLLSKCNKLWKKR